MKKCNCNCLANEIAKETYGASGFPGKHRIGKINFLCPMCKNNRRKNGNTHWLWHSNDGDFAGNSYECGKCHNYVQYLLDNEFYKEEFYFKEENIYIILDDKFMIFVNHSKALEAPYIDIHVLTKEQILDKAKLLLLFS